MTRSLGYYTGWAVVLVLLFIVPLLVVVIEYLRSVNRRLKNIESRLSTASNTGESIKNDSGDADC